MEKAIREPIVVVLGHVDAGKTSLLDRLRGTAVQQKEAGGITQHIGASLYPSDVLISMTGSLLSKYRINVKIPGVLFIDTPGHEAFSNLRYRGGSAADIAIIVVDITKGIEKQTVESINILKDKKVPFLIALNKVDLIAGWRSNPRITLEEDVKSQDPATQKLLDERIYTALGQLAQLGFDAEAYYRITSFTKQVAMIPVSATTGEGIPEMLTVLLGLVQNFMKNKLAFKKEPGRGIILEVREEEGIGTIFHVILLGGIVALNDKVVIGTSVSSKTTKIKGIYLPKPLDEMRDPRDKFKPVREVEASAGISIVVSDPDEAVAGAPMYVVTDEEDELNAKKEIEEELKKLIIKNDQVGVIIKVDALGSLEAMSFLLKQAGIPIRYAEVGPITKKDIIEAELVREKDKYLGAVLAFNQKLLVENPTVKIFSGKVMYDIIEEYQRYVTEQKEKDLHLKLEQITYPAKLQVIKGYIFRRSNPAIFGVRVIHGTLKPKVRVMNLYGKEIGIIEQIQVQGENVQELKASEEAAISIRDITIGRHIREDEVLYTLPNSNQINDLKKIITDPDDVKVLNEILQIRRKVELMYGY
ncbi:MAG: translation initiation factor IF-2 [Nitrososphaerota archaeon]|nr:translation initiation factor IF-2 [Nitrososphaerota archaeon]